jgi:hypothetical protein
MEDVGIFYSHSVNVPAILHILWPFGIFPPVLVHFTRFGMLHQEKSGNPGTACNKLNSHFFISEESGHSFSLPLLNLCPKFT